MNRKKNQEINAQIVLDVFQKYMSLSRYLFGQSEQFIYDINEMPKENEFYSPAIKIAKSFGIDWKKMTHEESNRIMLALLEKVYNEMTEVCDKDHIILETKIIIEKGKSDEIQ